MIFTAIKNPTKNGPYKSRERRCTTPKRGKKNAKEILLRDKITIDNDYGELRNGRF